MINKKKVSTNDVEFRIHLFLLKFNRSYLSIHL